MRVTAHSVCILWEKSAPYHSALKQTKSQEVISEVCSLEGGSRGEGGGHGAPTTRQKWFAAAFVRCNAFARIRIVRKEEQKEGFDLAV